MEPKMAGRACGTISANEHAQEQLVAQNVESRDAVLLRTDEVSGIPLGVTLLTMDGEIPVEFLSPGDQIITRDMGAITVNTVAQQVITTGAVRFAAGSLGHNRPDAHTILPRGQKVFVRDWRAKALYGQPSAMVMASRLLDGRFVRDVPNCTMTLFHLGFAAPHIIYAGGMELGVEPQNTTFVGSKDLF